MISAVVKKETAEEQGSNGRSLGKLMKAKARYVSMSYLKYFYSTTACRQEGVSAVVESSRRYRLCHSPLLPKSSQGLSRSEGILLYHSIHTELIQI